MDRKKLLIVSVAVEGGLFVMGLILANYAQLNIWNTFSISLTATVYSLLFCLPMFAFLLMSIRLTWGPFARLRRELEGKVRPLFVNSKMIDLALIALFAGLGEELIFRGWLQGVLIAKTNVWMGILLSSLIFGLAHYISTDYAIYAFITGIYLGLIYQVLNNLFIVMMIHAVYDFAALVYLVRKGGKVLSDLPVKEL